jgi:hypothetical protein
VNKQAVQFNIPSCAPGAVAFFSASYTGAYTYSIALFSVWHMLCDVNDIYRFSLANNFKCFASCACEIKILLLTKQTEVKVKLEGAERGKLTIDGQKMTTDDSQPIMKFALN